MVKQLAGSVREFKRDSILTPVFISLEVVMEMIIPLLTARLIDYGIRGNGGAGDIPYLLKMGGLLLLCCACSMSFGILAARLAAVASAGFAHNLRKDLFYRVQEYSFANIDRFSTGSLITRLTTDVSNIQNAYQMMLRIAVRAPMSIFFAVAMAMTLSVRLSVIFLCIIPFLTVGFILLLRAVYPVFAKMFRAYDEINTVIQENLSGIRVVKAYVREDYEQKKVQEVSTKICRIASRAERLVSLHIPMMHICIYSCILLIVCFGGRMVVTSGGSELSTGELFGFINYTMNILSSLLMLAMIMTILVMSRASAERVSEVLREKSDLYSPENPVTEVKDGSVRFENVGFSYAGKRENLCLSGVNLDVRPGQTIGIIGGTGSSKTSMVQLISRLYDVTEGRLLVGGVDVRRYDLTSLRTAVSVVMQKNILFTGTIRENLRWGNPDATDEQLEHACRMACADEFIREFPDGYDTRIDQGGTNVSGGQKQRLCIARALLKSPKILILDDSTSAVDTHTDAMIRQTFRQEIPGVTKFIIAQRISSIQDADRIVVLDGGRVAAEGTHEELLQSCPIYREVYDSQKKGGEDDV